MVSSFNHGGRVNEVGGASLDPFISSVLPYRTGRTINKSACVAKIGKTRVRKVTLKGLKEMIKGDLSRLRDLPGPLAFGEATG